MSALTGFSNSSVAEPDKDLRANTNVERLPAAAISPDAAPAPQVVSEAEIPENIVVESATSANPDSSASTTTAPATNPATDEPLFGTHRVQAGDYLGLIADRYGTSVDALMEINELSDNIIQIDQELRYPLPAN